MIIERIGEFIRDRGMAGVYHPLEIFLSNKDFEEVWKKTAKHGNLDEKRGRPMLVYNWCEKEIKISKGDTVNDGEMIVVEKVEAGYWRDLQA